MHLPAISPELGYLLLVLGLFLVPRVLQRFRLPGAITSVAIGAVLGMGFHAFQHDATVQWLGTLGIVSLFLFAGLEVDFEELRRGARVVAQHIALQCTLLAFAAIVVAAALGLREREATLLALALFTPSTGFILDALGAFGLDPEQRFWVRAKAVGSEIVALVILFVTVQSSDARTLVVSTGAMVALVAGLPVVFRLFSTRILPHAPRSEFTFLVIVAILSAFLTRRLGVYYLVGAFVVGLTAVRMRRALPGFVSEKVIGAVELFASFFVPFYFFKAGLHISAEDFSPRAFVLGALFLVTAVPVRVAMVVLHRRFVLGERAAEAARVGVSLVPTLVFTMVIANILVERYHVDRAIYGGLIVFALGNTLLPGLLLRARIEFEPHDEAGAEPRAGEPDARDGATVDATTEAELDDLGLLAGTLTTVERAPISPVGRAIRAAQDAAFAWIVGRGVPPRALIDTRLRQISPNAGRYWAAVVVAAALGSVGVLLESVPMLVAAAITCPVAVPVGGLALGLASGSPFLVLRTFLRGASAMVLSIGVAALVTRLVPYMAAPAQLHPHTPTLLDFAAASAAALVIVLAELRTGEATYTIAARVAFGHVVLVPVCVAGFTLGTGAWSSFGVTTWTLLANLATLVVVSLVIFLALGLHHVDARAVEDHALEGMSDSPLRSALLQPLRRLFASRWALVPRILLPLTLLALAAIPLHRALRVVAADVQIREAVRLAVAAVPARVLETRITIDGSGTSVAVLQVGSTRRARESREAIERALSVAVPGEVRVEVVAVADSSSLAQLEDRLEEARAQRTDGVEIAQEVAREVLSLVRARGGDGRHVLDVSTRVGAEGFEVRVVWVGPQPAPDEESALSVAASEAAARPVQVSLVAFPGTETAFLPHDPASLAEVFARAELAATVPGLVLCVTRPPATTPVRRAGRAPAVPALGPSFEGHRAIELLDADRFSSRFARGTCAAATAPAAGLGTSERAAASAASGAPEPSAGVAPSAPSTVPAPSDD